MAKKETFEIYEGFTKRKKKYIVFATNVPGPEAYEYCKKFFKCSVDHLVYSLGYLYKGELYLEDPDVPETRVVRIMYYVR